MPTTCSTSSTVSSSTASSRSTARKLVQTFLRKTIFERSPVAARDLLLGVPFDLVRGFWGKVVCPKGSLFSFESAVSMLRDGLVSLFAPFSWGAHLAGAYFPAELRNPIL